MKYFIVSLLIIISISSNPLKAQHNNSKPSQELKKSNRAENYNLKYSAAPKILEFYSGYSFFTDPGEYVSMYENLPDSIAALCRLIKSQLIHPVADLPKYRDLIPQERSYEDLKYPTVKTILAGLKSYNPEGLIFSRKPEERLIVSCRYHAILLASILKHRGIPTRLRYGFASYLYPGYHIYHVICEVWNKNEKRWILVDPDRQLINLTSGQFEFSNDVWIKYRHGELKQETYGVPNWWGAHPVLDVLCHDLASVLGDEHIYFNRPPISADTTMDVENLSSDQSILMDNISELMKNVDNNFYELKDFYDGNKQLQFDFSFKRDKSE
ncbi:MAG: transglutaminase-like domain-containing protein [Ignavibacteriaceae bacterium]